MAQLILEQKKAVLRERRKAASPDGAPAFRYAVHLARGSENILNMRELLIAFSERCRQPGTMEDLGYFLSKPGLLKRVPCLFLIVKRHDLKLEEMEVDDLLGALLLYEFLFLGVALRAYASNDRSGRGTMIALPQQRLKAAAIFSRVLLDRGARAILLSFRSGSEDEDKENTGLFSFLPSSKITAEWTWREREIGGYLPLEPTYEETLAKLGYKTRQNMRYYRRHAEKELGCVVFDATGISVAEYTAFNRVCMYAVEERVALWRLETMKDLKDPVILGMKDRDGQWLALLGGRRLKDRIEILWQMNRAGMPDHSLSTVMRSYCLEREIARGAKRLYIEGGTAHSLAHRFVREEVIDLVVVRRSFGMRLMKKLAANKIYPDNPLGQMLKRTDLTWYPC